MYSQKDVLWHCKYLWNYNTDQHEISGQYLDNENVSGDAVLWRHNKSKMAKSPYLSEKSSYFDKIWYTKADIEPDDSHWSKIKIFKIQDGGSRHLVNRFFGHNSSTDCQISAKFCMRKQNDMSTKATWQKLQIFKIQDGGRPPFWKS